MATAKKASMKAPAKKITDDQFDLALKDFRKNSQEAEKIANEYETKLTKLKEQYEPKIKPFIEARDAAFEIAKTYSNQNKKTLFNGVLSIETAYGIVGFSNGKPGVRLDEGVDEKTLPALFKKKKLQLYVVTKETIDKQALIRDRENEKLTNKLAAIGVSIKPEESFYIKPN